MADLPPCGIYRTEAPIGSIPKGRLVYFHNHGEPGPGVYLPARWIQNRAEFHPQGTVLTNVDEARWLTPLAGEGLYRVTQSFHCCEERCRLFEPEVLVMLGYDAEANPILFTPQFTDSVLSVPERGTRIDYARTSSLAKLRVGESHRENVPRVVH